MCDIIEYGRGSPKHITVEFERDPSLRATAIVFITRSPSGEEEGLKILVADNGVIMRVGQATRLIDGVDIV